MRIATWNVNGLRAAIRKGFGEHLDQLGVDALLLQEIRSLPEQLPPAWREPEGWHVHWHPAEKKGYAGTAIFTREPSERLPDGIDGGPDPEGRVLNVAYRGHRLVSLYQPSGSSGPEKQEKKEAFMARFFTWMQDLVGQDQPVIVAGDYNIAHTPDDIHNPSGNKKNSGFLPHERAWMTDLLAQGWRDTFRLHVGEQKGPYSWWSNRGRARELDRGWRIDYLLANPAASAVTHAFIHKEGGMTVSDHAPVVVDFA